MRHEQPFKLCRSDLKPLELDQLFLSIGNVKQSIFNGANIASLKPSSLVKRFCIRRRVFMVSSEYNWAFEIYLSFLSRTNVFTLLIDDSKYVSTRFSSMMKELHT
jgi:hypothetical protein